METRQLGKSAVQITPIILGTWQAGKRNWTDINDQEIVAGIRAAVEAGMTTIDTAEIYGDGDAERRVAEAIAPQRDQVTLLTKVFANHLHHDQVITACENSLKRLQTDYIDLYQIHWPAGSWNSDLVPIEETMAALNQLKEQGKIRAIGVSNFSLAQLQEAMEHGQIDSIQPPYSLFWRTIERDIQPFCAAQQISILAYSSLAQGFLTGKFGPEHQFAEGDHRSHNRLYADPENYQRVQTALGQLQPIAEAKNCSLGQLAISWLIRQPQTQAIVGARNPQQAIANAQAINVQLNQTELGAIDQIGRIVTDNLDADPLLWNW
ncbi:aldo/keto reductase [Picosynechococcus sp. NKBG15041c]|uniref:aldo/keto reductase n=1 Tax=Picosynechococcus sp. NKBG15041c TaxID=1407650 RepID=UPI00041C56A5|nr:aldo/keto reductase [Picosynechococcus sp. NKBG15041c]